MNQIPPVIVAKDVDGPYAVYEAMTVIDSIPVYRSAGWRFGEIGEALKAAGSRPTMAKDPLFPRTAEVDPTAL